VSEDGVPKVGIEVFHKDTEVSRLMERQLLRPRAHDPRRVVGKFSRIALAFTEAEDPYLTRKRLRGRHRLMTGMGRKQTFTSRQPTCKAGSGGSAAPHGDCG